MPSYFWLAQDFIQTPDACLEAVRQDPNAIQFIKNPSLEMQQIAIQGNPYVIQHLDQTHELCMLAVSTNGMVLQFIRNKTFDICCAAIKSNPLAITCISSERLDYQKLSHLAISHDPACIEYIHAPHQLLLSKAYDLPISIFS